MSEKVGGVQSLWTLIMSYGRDEIKQPIINHYNQSPEVLVRPAVCTNLEFQYDRSGVAKID